MDKDEFINKIVMGWMKNDLINIAKIGSDKNGDGSVNLPLVMLIVVYMDQLGAFLLGTDNSSKRINEYLKCFENPNEYNADLLWDLFRNGLAHEYFPRGGITRSKNRPAMSTAEGLGVVLDAESLLGDFLSSLELFKVMLTEDNFLRRMEEAKNKMEETYFNHKEKIDYLPNKLNVNQNSGYLGTNQTSTASGGTQVYSPKLN